MTDRGRDQAALLKPRADGLYDISTAADALGVHPQTLRFYERKGLIDPVRSAGGQRRYSDDHLAQLASIQSLTGEGFNLAAVQRILQLEAEVEALKAELKTSRRVRGRRARGDGGRPLNDQIRSADEIKEGEVEGGEIRYGC